jgi:prolyl 4-hydroxylase
MKMKCAPSCQTCDLIDISNRCPPLGDNVRPGLLPGELNAMFERIVDTAPGNRTDRNDFAIDEGMTNYTVTVHSRPKPLDDDEGPIVSVKRDLEQPPWIITFENFISDEECEHLIELGYKSEYKRSEDVGKLLPDGTFDSVKSETRTSEK